jgi:K(+)-stimulated pyrophosphate-energized sodium pump
MESMVIYLVPALGVFGLIVMAIKSAWVSKQPSGDENMVELATYIATGCDGILKSRVESSWLFCSYHCITFRLVWNTC